MKNRSCSVTSAFQQCSLFHFSFWPIYSSTLWHHRPATGCPRISSFQIKQLVQSVKCMDVTCYMLHCQVHHLAGTSCFLASDRPSTRLSICHGRIFSCSCRYCHSEVEVADQTISFCHGLLPPGQPFLTLTL